MIDFIKEMTTLNAHHFWHWAGGMFFYRLFTYTPLLWRIPFRAVIAIAVLYEVITLYLYGYGGYSGGLSGYIADTLGDILLAMAGAFCLMEKK